MNIRKTLFLFAILFLGTIYAYKVEYLGARKKAADLETENKLFSFSPDSVRKIAISNEGKVIELIKEENGWKITAPVAARADRAAVLELLDTVANSSGTETVEGDPKDFGLEPATVQIDFYHGEKPDTLLIGTPSPTGTSIYVRTSRSGKIKLISAPFARSVSRNLFQLREKRLLDGRRGEVTKVEIEKGEMFLSLEKGDREEWIITSPVKAPANGREVAGFIDGIFNASAIAFADGTSRKDAGLEKPAGRVTLWIKGTKMEMIFGGETGDRLGTYVATGAEEAVAVAPGALFAGLPVSADRFRENPLSRKVKNEEGALK